MKTILEELYNGNIFPDELIVSNDPEYRPLNRKIASMMEMWEKKLSEDDFKHFKVLMDLRCDSSLMEASASFVYGFKLGAMIMVEVFAGKEELARGGDRRMP